MSRSFKHFFNYWINDIRFWILLFFLARLWGIWHPPLEVLHNWRQVNVNMVARNFLETGPELFFPRLDMAGDLSGITGMEFPFLNYLIYLPAKLFGYEHWYGRMINLIISSLGVYYFYALIRDFLKRERLAFFAALLLLASNWLIYSRKIMPDTFSVSLVLAGVYYGLQYLNRGKIYHIWLFFILFTLGSLSKIPAASWGIVLIPALLCKRKPLAPRIFILLYSALSIYLILWWYLHWTPHLVDKYGFWHFYLGTGMNEGIQELKNSWQDTFSNFFLNPLKYTGLLAFTISIGIMINKKEWKLIGLFSLILMVFVLFTIKAGGSFSKHAYYMIPMVPAFCLIAAYLPYTIIKPYWLRISILILILSEGIVFQQHDFRINEKEKFRLKAEQLSDDFIEMDELIAINGGNNPQDIYFFNRKGWSLNTEDLMRPEVQKELKQKNCRYIISIENSTKSPLQLEGDYKLIFKDSDYAIYRVISAK